MTCSETSPPAFLWDEWYRSIGGRRIHIKEVDSILTQIREHQYPRFNGSVSAVRVNFKSTTLAASAIKQRARELGADEVVSPKSSRPIYIKAGT